MISKREREKGSLLAIAAIFSIIIALLCTAYLYISQSENILAIKVRRSREAFYLAENGIDRAKSWIKAQDMSPEEYNVQVLGGASGTDAFDPFTGWNALTGYNGRYRVLIDPDDGNIGMTEKTYVIISSGTATWNMGQPGRIKTIRETIRAINYTRFSYFSYKEWDDPNGATGNGQGSRHYFTWLDDFDGDVHTNDQISIYGGEPTGPAPPPMFSFYGGIYDVYTSEDVYYFTDGLRSTGGSGGGNDLSLPIGQYPVKGQIEIFKRWDEAPGSFLQWIQPLADLSLAGDRTIEIRSNSIAYSPGPVQYNMVPEGRLVYVGGNADIQSWPTSGFEGRLTVAVAGNITITDDINYSTTTQGIIGLVTEGDIIIDKPLLNINVGALQGSGDVSTNNTTYISAINTSVNSGTINQIELDVSNVGDGTIQVFSAYQTFINTFTPHDVLDLNVTGTGVQVFNAPVDFPGLVIDAGEYLGFYSSIGGVQLNMESPSGSGGIYYKQDDQTSGPTPYPQYVNSIAINMRARYINDINIDAVMISSGSFRAQDWNNTNVPPGGITIFGGLYQRTRGALGTRPGAYSETEMTTGYSIPFCRNDTRMIETPPPWFPKHIVIETVTWEEKPEE